MNWQFFGTAGVISVALFIIAIIFGIVAIITKYDNTYERCRLVLVILLLIIVAFWTIMGFVATLNAIWGWGLIK